MNLLTFHRSRGALYFPQLKLWLDPQHGVQSPEIAFVSHAHADHSARHKCLLCTPATRELLAVRLPGKRREHVVDFYQPIRLTDLFSSTDVPLSLAEVRLTLIPAGHVLGSAMLLLETDDHSVLYTGDFKLRRGVSCEPCTPVQADVLILESTFGKARFTLPEPDPVWDELIDFCQSTLAAQRAPILLVYSLGKAQEVLAQLRRLPSPCPPILLSDPVANITHVYERFGHSFPTYAAWTNASDSTAIILASPSAKRQTLIDRFPNARFACVTGWALDPSTRFRNRVDAAFPITDHADFPDLVQMVRTVNPREVVTVHGFADEFAAHLRSLGFSSRSLSSQRQLQLPLDDASSVRPQPIFLQTSR